MRDSGTLVNSDSTSKETNWYPYSNSCLGMFFLMCVTASKESESVNSS